MALLPSIPTTRPQGTTVRTPQAQATAQQNTVTNDALTVAALAPSQNTDVVTQNPAAVSTESPLEKQLKDLINLWTQQSQGKAERNTEYLTKKRDEEYRLLKQAFPSIQGDTWETAVGNDTISNQNLQAFKDRWDKAFEDQDYDPYSYSNIYGGTAGLGMDVFGYDTEETSPVGFFGIGSQQFKSGYLGGLK